jgi:hypothetical protein
MDAQQARLLFEQSEKENADKWYEGFKHDLFATIERQARSRSTALTLGVHHELNKAIGWVTYMPLAKKVKDELSQMGYTVKIETGDNDGYVHIAW